MEVKSNMTLQQFAEAMKALDLSSVPEEKRREAVVDHFWKVMIEGLKNSDRAAEILRERARRRWAAMNDTRRRGRIILPGDPQ